MTRSRQRQPRPDVPKGRSKSTLVAAVVFAGGIVLMLLGAMKVGSLVALLPGLLVMAISGVPLIKHIASAPIEATRDATLPSLPTLPELRVSAAPLKYQWVAASFEILASEVTLTPHTPGAPTLGNVFQVDEG